MFLANILYWWYGGGLFRCIHIIKDRLVALADYFSINLLASTLFAPYRQISAGSVAGSLSVQMQAFFDKLLSRFIGAIVRSFMIIIGIIAMILQSIIGSLILIMWLIVPLLPFVGFIVMAIGWVPQWTM